MNVEKQPSNPETTSTPHSSPLIPHPSKKLVVGLIGGIGSGKTAVAEAFARRGAYLISADAIGHEALRQPDIRNQLVQWWGPGILDGQGAVDRRKVADLVFADREKGPARLRALENLVHPWIRQGLEEEIARASRDERFDPIVLDAAIMLEAGWDVLCDRIVFVQAPRKCRERRMVAGRGWTATQLQDRERSQLSLKDKLVKAHDVLDNSGSLAELEVQVDHLWQRWDCLPARETSVPSCRGRPGC
jgi:dephospho-CoA kinase